MSNYTASALVWQNFYLLVGTSAATLVGLMFVAVTFGASLVTPNTSFSARSFLDPIFRHLVQVLLTACLMLVPTMGPRLLAVLLLVISMGRAVPLRKIYRDMHEANRMHGDIEASDWLSGIVVPLVCHLLLATSAILFATGRELAFDVLAIVTVVTLMNGLYGAWELLVWMALRRSKE